MKEFWDQRYSQKEYAYGETPNEYFRKEITYADADPTLALQWLNAAAATTLVHGHTHRPGSEQFPEGWQRHVLSDWDMDHAMHGRAEVLRWACTGFSRHPLGFS